VTTLDQLPRGAAAVPLTGQQYQLTGQQYQIAVGQYQATVTRLGAGCASCCSATGR
jgi:hypothetical protein